MRDALTSVFAARFSSYVMGQDLKAPLRPGVLAPLRRCRDTWFSVVAARRRAWLWEDNPSDHPGLCLLGQDLGEGGQVIIVFPGLTTGSSGGVVTLSSQLRNRTRITELGMW